MFHEEFLGPVGKSILDNVRHKNIPRHKISAMILKVLEIAEKAYDLRAEEGSETWHRELAEPVTSLINESPCVAFEALLVCAAMIEILRTTSAARPQHNVQLAHLKHLTVTAALEHIGLEWGGVITYEEMVKKLGIAPNDRLTEDELKQRLTDEFGV